MLKSVNKDTGHVFSEASFIAYCREKLVYFGSHQWESAVDELRSLHNYKALSVMNVTWGDTFLRMLFDGVNGEWFYLLRWRRVDNCLLIMCWSLNINVVYIVTGVPIKGTVG